MILLRHGQSLFNLHFTIHRKDPGIPDPHLTKLGQEQAEAAAEALHREEIRQIIVSPYTRALQTAKPIAAKLGVPVRITPQVGERYAFACDIGSPRSALADSWPDHAFDHLDEIWWPQQEESEASILARARAFRRTLAASTDWAHTLVVSHWGFILAMTGKSIANGQWLRCDPTEAGPDKVVWQH
jgi:broad specificity phosphatase PhoE